MPGSRSAARPPRRPLPVTERLAAEVLVLPTGPAIDPAAIDTIAALLRLAVAHGPQLARRLGLPFRGGGGFTGSPVPDVRAMRESLMALWPALLSGSNVILHAAGWVEGSLVASIEKMAQDVAALEVFHDLLAAEIPVDEESLALDAFREVGPSGTFLGAAHTLRHLREQVARRSREPLDWRAWLDRYEDPGMDPAVEEELRGFVARRKRELRRDHPTAPRPV